MVNTLVAYFSATGTTQKVAEEIAKTLQADLFEIEPEIPYTAADLNWNDSNSRSSKEMADKSYRPAIKNRLKNVADYDTIFVGFPIWWYVAPTIINTFLESYELSGKKIIPFATSGGSGMGRTNAELAPSCPGAGLVEGRVFSGPSAAKAWLKELGLLK